MPSRIEIIETDITNIGYDAIVNPTNISLKPESDLEKAIHERAGPKLLEECAHVAPCPVGEARITRGYNLKTNFVIHVVDPVWGGGETGEDQLLASCYQNIFKLAESFDVKSIAIPPLSIGEKGFPGQRAAIIAMQQLLLILKNNSVIQNIALCCHDAETIEIYETAFDKSTTTES